MLYVRLHQETQGQPKVQTILHGDGIDCFPNPFAAAHSLEDCKGGTAGFLPQSTWN